MSFREKLKKSFILQRAMVTSLASLDLINLITLFYIQNADRFFISFYTTRLIFYVVTYIFSFVRLSSRFYFPAFRLMPAETYWTFVFFIYFSMKSIFLHKFVEVFPGQKIFEASLVVVFLGTIFMSIHSQPWSLKGNKQRKKAINSLTKKAKLTKQEINAVIPMLSEKGSFYQAKPIIWIVLEVVIGIFLGAIIGSYAKELVDLFISQTGVELINFFPPY